MKRAKSIDEIYGEVRDCDMVISNDAPLVTALNSRIDKASLGLFAYTPKQIAGKEAVRTIGRGTMGDLAIIASVCDETGYGFKQVHSEIENIRTIRRYRAHPEDYIFTSAGKKIFRSFSALPTLEKVMGSFDTRSSPLYMEKSRIAVVGVDLFDDLDKHFIPEDFREVDLFTDDEFELSHMYQIGNDRQIAENTVDLITPDNVDDTAIVMDVQGPVADAVRSALYRKGYPFKNTMAVRDLSQIRDFLQFLSLSLNFGTIRVRHAREIFSSYGGVLDFRHDNYLLSREHTFMEDGKSKNLIKIMENVRQMTFGEVMDGVVHKMQKPQVKILLEDMGYVDRKITSKLVNELTYAVDNVKDLHHNEQTPEDEKRGVLLVDCTNSVYIDRPMVIFLGIGREWSPSIVGKDYIDREDEKERNVLRFRVLLQQGTSRVYAVNSMRSGKPAKPCDYFEDIYGKAVEVFDDIMPDIPKGSWVRETEEIPSKKGVVDMGHPVSLDWRFSKSTYNDYVTCPLKYMFKRIVRSPDSEHTVLGNILHEFAELYLCYPDTVREKGAEYYLDIFSGNYSGISCEQMEPVDRTKLEVGMRNIMNMLDSMRPKNVPLDRKNSDSKYPNRLLESEGLDMKSTISELEVNSLRHPIKGTMDLTLGSDSIVDYKTGKSKTYKEIKKNMTSEAKLCEYQPIIYLSLFSEKTGKLPCRFNLFFIEDNVEKTLTDDKFDFRANMRSIYVPDMDLEEFILTDDCDLKDAFFGKDYERYLSNWKNFISVLVEYGILDKPLDPKSDDLRYAVINAVGAKNNKTGMETARKAISKINDGISAGMICGSDCLIIPKDTMKTFLEKLKKDHENASEMIRSGFSKNPKADCKKCDYIQMCTRASEKSEEEGYDE